MPDDVARSPRTDDGGARGPDRRPLDREDGDRAAGVPSNTRGMLPG